MAVRIWSSKKSAPLHFRHCSKSQRMASGQSLSSSTSACQILIFYRMCQQHCSLVGLSCHRPEAQRIADCRLSPCHPRLLLEQNSTDQSLGERSGCPWDRESWRGHAASRRGNRHCHKEVWRGEPAVALVITIDGGKQSIFLQCEAPGPEKCGAGVLCCPGEVCMVRKECSSRGGELEGPGTVASGYMVTEEASLSILRA